MKITSCTLCPSYGVEHKVPIATCALCRREADLEESHLIPRFVARSMRRDSPNPFFRNGRDPNRRVQDAPKATLLCHECEQRLAGYESAFAKDIFAPTMKGRQLDDFVITRDHYRFCTSVVWRHLATVRRMHEEDVVPDDDYTERDWASIEAAEDAFRQSLLGVSGRPRDIGIHLFCARSTTETEFEGINALVNLTMGFALRRHEDTPERLYSIAFMNGLLLITLIAADEACRADWIGGNTSVEPGALWRNYRQEIRDAQFGGVLVAMAKEQVRAQDAMSSEQRKVIRDALSGIDHARWVETPHGRAVLQDHLNRERPERENTTDDP